MSWSKLNNFELQALRKLLCLDVSEAAELIGGVTNRTWQYWEVGRNEIPCEIDYEMYGLTSLRNQLIDKSVEEVELGDLGPLRWYHMFEPKNGERKDGHIYFIDDYPACNKVHWRLHQSVLAYLFAEGGEVELDANAPLNKESYIYKWFNFLTDEQLEDAKNEEIFRQKGIID
ncbi:YdiL family protein [Pseudoalteromonas luteoviolacea]|uniref:Aca2/YdiL-like domain-containing protein n=1 Tax=Pseudoalteromonas luteoviolacea TaxID=43657 RepID=UPI001F395A1E|nr:DUF1870 family protein [Pseudoalteromonas luteoviolacea]MCF6442523.1 YdiL family protein [Pseudoalteromonas luteoviolacea]